MVDLVLASSSPRRAELLRQINLPFRMVSPDISEHSTGAELPDEYAARLSRQKAMAVFELLDQNPGSVVLGADTVVVQGKTILGKPDDERSAVKMLMRLSGRKHRVLTAVTLLSDDDEKTSVVETIVTFRELNSEECVNYWLSGEPRDKAGAYGIQGLGAVFVASIEGSYSNVVGLPLMETARCLRHFGIDCLAESGKRFELNRK